MTERLSITEFVNRAAAVHNGKYDYSKVQYVNAHTKVTIICPVHGSFEQMPASHVRCRCGCPICALGGTPIERFWGYVRKDGSTSPHAVGQCWRWIGETADNGYGRFWAYHKSFAAHRFSYELHYGHIPDGQYILHECDNPQCTNPDHLFVGTIADNARDMIAKGRNVPTRGQRCASCKLTPQQVCEIRKMYATGKYRLVDISKMFSIGKRTVSDIVHKYTWNWLND